MDGCFGRGREQHAHGWEAAAQEAHPCRHPPCLVGTTIWIALPGNWRDWCGCKFKGMKGCLRRYFAQVMRCAFSNPTVLTEITMINHMMVPPSQLFSRGIVSRVLALSMQDALQIPIAAVRPSASSSAAGKPIAATKVAS